MNRMIEKEKLYNLLEFLLDKKRILIGSILLILLSSILKRFTSFDFIFFIPILLFYELIILIIDYRYKNVMITAFELIGISFSMAAAPWFDLSNYATLALVFLVGYRLIFKFFLIIEPNGWKNLSDYFYLSLKYSPFLIHRCKEELIQFLRDRDLNESKK